jgi:hypothetical protein
MGKWLSRRDEIGLDALTAQFFGMRASVLP